MDMSRSTFVPNAFQTPNAYVDLVMPYLTGEEYKVLTYAVRRILGFQKRQDHISLSQFTDGTKSKDGEVLDSGTGLSVETVKKCLASLVSFGLMLRLKENDTKTNLGTLWALQWDGEKVNWQALKERNEKKSKTHKKKMAKARSMRQTPVSAIEDGGANGIENPPTNGIETQKTEKASRKKVKAAAPQPPEILLFKEVVKHYPKQAQRDMVIDAVKKVNARLRRDATLEDLQPFFKEWCKVSANDWSLVWLMDWAVPGTINGKVNHASNPKPVETQPSSEALARAERINELRRAGHIV
jgi:hypothetical protein